VNRRLQRYAPVPTLAVLAGFAIVFFPPLLLLDVAGLLAWLWVTRTTSGQRFAKRFVKTTS
jgi:hypothetical protein